MRRRLAGWATGVILVAAALVACRQAPVAQEVEQGRAAFVGYGCHTCHSVGDIRQANARVGPRLDGFADQRIIAGRLPNNPPNLVRFIQNPQEVSPGSAMPNMNVSDEDAAAIAAYLHSLQEQ